MRLRAAGAQEQVTALLNRDPGALAERAAAHVALDNPGGVAWLLEGLRAAGAQEQFTALLHRDPAAHVSLEDPQGVARLVDVLRAAGAQEQVTKLADGAAHTPFGDQYAVVALLHRLQDAGAQEQVTALLRRLPGEGMFELFREFERSGAREGRQDRFWFGREADGSPAEPWGWEDLD